MCEFLTHQEPSFAVSPVRSSGERIRQSAMVQTNVRVMLNCDSYFEFRSIK